MRSVFFLLLWLLPLSAGFSQDEETGNAVFFPPDSVRSPHREEAPRYPLDVVIGALGRGTAPQAAWLYAREFLNALIRLNRNAPALSSVDNSLYNRISGEIEILKPEKFRLGGGRIEADGTASFLVRFVSQERSMTGELYLYQQEAEDPDGSGPWQFDDLLLEESQDLIELQEARRYDFTSYERLY